MRFHFCQYIADRPSPDDTCKCGREVKPGSPYCPEHDARCYPAAEAVEGQEKLPVAVRRTAGADVVGVRAPASMAAW